MLVLVVGVGMSLVSCGGQGEDETDKDPGPTPTFPKPPDFGVTIVTNQNYVEETQDFVGLIQETFSDYATQVLKDPQNGQGKFTLNLALTTVRIEWIVGKGGQASTYSLISQNSEGYNENNRTIILQPNLLEEVSTKQYPNTLQSSGVPVQVFETDEGVRLQPGENMPAFDFTAESMFGVTDDAVAINSNRRTVFKFVLAHEMTHALVKGNNRVLDSFIEKVMNPNRGGNDCPIPERNDKRLRTQNAKDEENLADFMAASLYASSLMGDKGHDFLQWRDRDLQTLLHPRLQ